MTPEQIALLIELLSRPEEEVLGELDEYAMNHPNVAPQIAQLKAFLESLYDALPEKTLAAVTEALALFKTGSGPLKPDLGDTA